MEKLTPRARSLVRAGREAMRPSESDRARVSAALRNRLGAAVVLGSPDLPRPTTAPADTAGSVLPAAAGRPLWSLVSMAAVGVGVVGGALILALRSEPSAADEPAPPAPTVAVAEAVPPPTSAPVATADPELPAETVARAEVAPAAPRRPSRLAEEVAILSRATADLRAGRAADALRALDEHQRKFPSGALAEERRAAKAEALCALGRVSEGAAVLSRLSPKSPHAARARQFCATRGATRR